MFRTLKRSYRQSFWWFQTDQKSFSVGGSTGPVTTADMVIFATNTLVAVTSANLPAARCQLTSGGGRYWGYMIGGTDSTDTSQTSAAKITYSNNTTSTNASAALPAARSAIVGASYFTSLYSFGGSAAANSNDQTAAYKTLFSSDVTSAVTSANLATGRGAAAALSSYWAAMCLGGFTGATAVQNTMADKMPFATETSANNTSLVLPNKRGGTSFPAMNSRIDQKGYVSGCNQTSGTPFWQLNWLRVNYSTDTCSSLSAAYDSPIGQGSGHSSQAAAYTCGGYAATQVANTYKLMFSTETLSLEIGMYKTVAKAQACGVG